MALYIKNPDSNGTCCECSARPLPCDSCESVGCASYTIECVSTTTSCCSSSFPDCLGTGTSCTTENADIPCPDAPGGIGLLVVTVQARLVITGLTAGQNYSAFIYFSDDTSHQFDFTASSDSYTTDYVDVPNPAFNEAGISVTRAIVACPPTCECSLALPIIGGTNLAFPLIAGGAPYEDYAAAQTALINIVSNCIAAGYGYNESFYLDSFSASNATSNTLQLNASNAVESPLGTERVYIWMYASINLKAGTTLTYSYTASLSNTLSPFANNGSVYFYLWKCDGTLVTAQSKGTTTGTFTRSITEDSEYIIQVGMYVNADSPPPTASASLSATISSSFLTVNPVIAKYIDGTTTRKLEACPRLLLPPLTEATGDWYADCATANTVINDSVSNCIGLNYGGGNSFVATNGGTSLTLSVTSSPDPLSCWASVNAESGETLTISYSGGSDIAAAIYDYTGTLVESIAASSSPFVSAALPYTGRYMIYIQSVSSPPPTSTTWPITAIITSSGTISINEITALYDNGATCASRLDCGDSC